MRACIGRRSGFVAEKKQISCKNYSVMGEWLFIFAGYNEGRRKKAITMKNQMMKLAAALVLAVSLGACVTINEEPAPSNTTQNETTAKADTAKKDTDKTTDTNKTTDETSKSQDSEKAQTPAQTPAATNKTTTDKKDTSTSDKTKTDTPQTSKPATDNTTGQTKKPAAATSDNAGSAAQNAGSTQNTQQLLAAEIAAKLSQAFNNQGDATSQIVYEQTESGNEEAIFTATVAGQPVEVYLTAASDANDPAATFEANTAADEANNMQVMNEWTNNGNTVRVVRNNMANGNFVEVLDSKQRAALHIVDQTPEQLETVLQALSAIGYPTGE